MKEKKSDLWRTPKVIYQMLDKRYRFDFDPCPYPKPNFNGLEIEWGKRNFVNPPYSQTELWVRKALIEHSKRKLIVMLLRLDASTIWFRDLILPNAQIKIFEDRLHFINQNGKASRSNFASILIILNRSKKRANIPILYWRRKPTVNEALTK